MSFLKIRTGPKRSRHGESVSARSNQQTAGGLLAWKLKERVVLSEATDQRLPIKLGSARQGRWGAKSQMCET